jgi:murein DD-endopeptidase MepM/ murein hydrolase activator NlpD
MPVVKPKHNSRMCTKILAFPRRHLIIVATLGFTLLISLLYVPMDSARGSRNETPLTLKVLSPDLPVNIEATPKDQWHDINVGNGDNLSLVFHRAKLNDSDIYEITHSSRQAKNLSKIHPGETLSFIISETGQLQSLRHIKTPLETTLYQRNKNSFDIKELIRTPEARRSFTAATISSSLFLAGQSAGLSQNMIMEMANIFSGVIDFVLDPRHGDSFNLLYEELYLDDEKYSDGAILAAEFINQGQSYTAYRYTDKDGKSGYFNGKGVSMRKAFLRAPLDFTRVSSSFNLKRLHPVYKDTRPHRGIDYAAPRGTPVYAAGDGRVVKTGYNNSNGNYVFIQHGQQYTTKYLHLNKRAVKNGSRVKQQEIIGWVGSTGTATGPHLHYEFLVNGVHRNPRTILRKLPKAKSISTNELPRFMEQTQNLKMQLASHRELKLADASSITATF